MLREVNSHPFLRQTANGLETFLFHLPGATFINKGSVDCCNLGMSTFKEHWNHANHTVPINMVCLAAPIIDNLPVSQV
jgi:hypothetical protein